MKRPHFTVADRFMAMFHAGMFAKALHGIAVDERPVTDSTPLVRGGEFSLDAAPVEAPLPWTEWLQQLPPVDGWTSTASYMAQHGMSVEAVPE